MITTYYLLPANYKALSHLTLYFYSFNSIRYFI